MSQVRPAPEQGRFQYSVLPSLGALAAAVLLGALAVAPCSADPTLPLAEAERLAIERDAVLQQLAVESAGMREQAIAEGQLMDPRLRVGAVNVPVNDFSFTAEDMTMVEVGVTQEFPAGRTRELARKRMTQIAQRQGIRGERPAPLGAARGAPRVDRACVSRCRARTRVGPADMGGPDAGLRAGALCIRRGQAARRAAGRARRRDAARAAARPRSRRDDAAREAGTLARRGRRRAGRARSRFRRVRR